MRCIQFDLEKKYINDFINFSIKLYKNDCTENKEETKQILEGNHPLSKYFNIYKFLIYDNKKVVGRFAITAYPDDTTAYLGFFECVNNKDVAKYLFDYAFKFAKENNFKNIVGPVNSSFWIKYRLKINMFDKRPYTGEPYNKDYYLKMFLDNNYKIIEHYTSSIYSNIDYTYENEKYEARYKEFTNNGYLIQSPDMSKFEEYLKDVYKLLTELYSDFPIYKNLSEEDFIKTFSSYKKIMNPEMTKLAFYNNKLVGFYISIPNYNNIVYNLNLINILKVLHIKKNPKEYIMLYMGVDQEHRGLGKAIIYTIISELMRSELPSIGALARDGKLTQNYVEEKIKYRYEYVLLEVKIDD